MSSRAAMFVVALPPIVVGSCAAALSGRTAARANDLGDAVDYAAKHFDRRTASDFEAQWRERSRHGTVGMLSSRDVDHGKPLSDYDCLDSAIDADVVMRSSSKEKAALRGCLEHRFERDTLPGYRTLGDVRLDRELVRPIVEANAEAYEVPAVILDGIIMLASGYRPHAESDEGHVGLMQLRRDLLSTYGVDHGDLRDPRENVRAGAAYVRALVFTHGGLKKALLIYPHGPERVAHRFRMKRWFVNFLLGLYLAQDRQFPNALGAENMTFVWTWLD